MITFAQQYPVSVSSFITPPYPIYVEDLTGQNGLGGWTVSMTFNDFNEPSRDVFLRLKIESDLLSLRTNLNSQTLPNWNILPGIPQSVSSFNLEQYLSPVNLIATGSYSAQFRSSGKFPEGFYSFCVEVVDRYSGEVLSQQSCSQLWIQLQDQPIINTPQCGSVVDPATFNSINFQWQQLGNLSQNSIASTEYQLTLYEINAPVAIEPQAAINNGQVVLHYQSFWSNTTALVYDISYPQMIKGKRYAWHVQARDISGRDVFKNGGFSQACWFAYGYPENGHINLKYPADSSGFSKAEFQYFDWSGPDNMIPMQAVEYHITIKELNDGQNKDNAMLDNPIWHYYGTEQLYQDQGYDMTIDKAEKKLAASEYYVWQVEAFTGDQKIAESDVNVFSGPPFLEEFYADMYRVEVTKLFGKDLNNLSGEGRIQVAQDGREVNITFENIGLVNIAGRYYLNTGIITSDFDEPIPISLTPEMGQTGTTTAILDGLKLSKDQGFQVRATLEWDLYLPTIDGSNTVQFASAWFNYPFYEMSGVTSLKEDYTFNLLEPLNFDFELSDQSTFIVRSNVVESIFNGQVTLPENVLSRTDQRVSYPFNNQKDLYYIQENNRTGTDKILAYQALNTTLTPTSYTFDFSDTQSPYASNDPYWKGFFPGSYVLGMEKKQDYYATLNFDADLTYAMQQVEGGPNVFNVDAKGLNLKVDNFKLDGGEEGVKYNTFPSNLYDFNLNIVNSEFEDGAFHGGMKVPVLSETKEFAFEIPFGYSGFEDGYLTEDIDGKTYTFNPEGGSQVMYLNINRAVFRERNHLEMDMDIEWPEFNIRMNGTDKFCVWGNFDIGFVEPNGALALKQQVSGQASGYDITMEVIGAGRSANLYSFGSTATIMMGEDIAGEDGPPIINAYSIMESTIIPETYSGTYNAPYEEDINSENLFDITNSGEGLDVETEYEQDLAALLYGVSDDLAAGYPVDVDTTTGQIDSLFAGLGGGDGDQVSIQEALETLDQLIKLLIIVAPDDTTKQKLIQVQDLLAKTQDGDLAEIIKDIQENGFDVNRILMGQIERMTKRLDNKVKEKIGIVHNKVREMVYKPVDLAIKPFDDLIDESIKTIVDNLAQCAGGNEVVLGFLDTIGDITANSIKLEFHDAIYGSVETNIVAKINGGIDKVVTDNVSNFITGEIPKLGGALLNKDQNNSDAFNQLFAETGTMVENMGDDLVQELATVNGGSIKSTGQNLVKDAYNDISWAVIAGRIKEDMLALVDDAIKDQITNSIADLFGEGEGGLAGGIAAGVLANVELDFSNLGEKVKSGDLKGIVKFDPTTIKVESKVADFVGTLKFTKDDPIWGDSWQAKLDATIKKPKTFSAYATYVNGKVDGYCYWFLELGISKGLNVALAPAVVMDGIGGKVFRHMRYDRTANNYFPDQNTKFGVGANLFLVDGVPANRDLMGRSMRLNVTAEVTILQDYFTIDIRGTTGVAFKKTIDEEATTDYSKCMVTGDGFIGYNSKDQHVLGEFTITTNTAPLLCAGGTLGLSIKPGYWNVYVGKKESPIYAKLFCKDFAKFEAWFDLSNTYLSAGLRQRVVIAGKSPWIKVLGKEVQPFAGFGYDFMAEVGLQVSPKFRLEEASISLSAFAEVGANYKKQENGEEVIKKWVLAGAYLDGSGKYKNTDEESYITAALAGKIKLLGIGVGVDMEVYKEFAKKD